MRIAEIYSSRQGEGLLTGMPSVFVRASGCNLRCWFCDTPYTSWDPEGEDWSVEEIVAEVQRLAQIVGWDQRAQLAPAHQIAEPSEGGPALATSLSHPTIRHVVVTGGEPMLFAEMLPLMSALNAAGLHITIETAGTLFLPVTCDLMSISPKLAGSTPSTEKAGKWAARHEQTRHQPEVIRRLMNEYDYQLKFVIDTPADLAAVREWMIEFPQVRRDRVLLMPQGTDPAGLSRIEEWLAPCCRQEGFVFCPRKHIEWYGAVRGT